MNCFTPPGSTVIGLLQVAGGYFRVEADKCDVSTLNSNMLTMCDDWHGIHAWGYYARSLTHQDAAEFNEGYGVAPY